MSKVNDFISEIKIEPVLILTLAPLLGLAFGLLIVINSSYFGIPTVSVAWIAGLAGAALTTYMVTKVRQSQVILAGLLVLLPGLSACLPLLGLSAGLTLRLTPRCCCSNEDDEEKVVVPPRRAWVAGVSL